MASRCFSALTILAMALVAGCASEPERVHSKPMSQVYDDIHRQGARDMVDLLRDGMANRQVLGMTDPYYPVRLPEEVIPIWVRDTTDPVTGRRKQGHVEWVVIRPSTWAE